MAMVLDIQRLRQLARDGQLLTEDGKKIHPSVLLKALPSKETASEDARSKATEAVPSPSVMDEKVLALLANLLQSGRETSMLIADKLAGIKSNPVPVTVTLVSPTAPPVVDIPAEPRPLRKYKFTIKRDSYGGQISEIMAEELETAP